MESTPGLDNDMPHTPAAAMSFAPSASSSSFQNPQGAADQSSGAAASVSQSSSGQQKFSNGPHIRSRITVVCAECKRLKLKCDRRTPCSSCLKRDTVQRCVYSQAAAEKVDVQTLHNRVIEIERVLGQLQSASPNMSVSAALAGIPAFKQSASVVAASPSRAGTAIASQPPTLMAGLPCNDRALLAQGASGSSVVISLEDVVSLWLGELEEFSFDGQSPRTSGPDTSSSSVRSLSSSTTVKLEPAQVSIPPAVSPTSFSPGNGAHITGMHSTLHPPASYDAFLPPPSAGPSALPQVTAALIAYLPTEPMRARYLKAFRETMLLHPCFNVQHFEQRIAAIYTWAEHGETVTAGSASSANGVVSAYGSRPMSKQQLARDIFFSSAKPGSASAGRGAGQNANAPKPTLSFFAAACAAFALGSLVARDENPPQAGLPPPSEPSSSSPASRFGGGMDGTNGDGGGGGGDGGGGGGGDTSGTPAMLFALSEQALQLFEKTAAYDLDSVITMILQVLYMLHEGGMSVAQSVFPLVGKMVNVARMMGLAMDPDEFPGTYSLFEAETRRRVWWDVCYYDLFVADCMGHPPLIADNTHTTRLPADVDESNFTPSCTSLPTPESADDDASSVYFGLKCRLAQLVKNVKKQTFRDPLGLSEDGSAELSIEQAGVYEGEVITFLKELPVGFKLDMTHDLSKPLPPPCTSASPFRQAQACELAILANRLIVKLYLPFLKDAALTHRPAHQAMFGTISAAHGVVAAARVLHAVWGTARPAVFDFYDFGRTLFDAGVVCAHAVIQEPMSVVAGEGLKGVTCALEILKVLGRGGSGVEGVRAERSRGEAVRIVEIMKSKAEAARNGGSSMSASASAGAGSSAGTKRKRGEMEPDGMVSSSSSSFQLPFVGAAVSSSKTERPRASGMASSSARAATTPAPGRDVPNGDGKSSRPEAKKQAKEKDKDKDKDKDKTSKYLSGPLRVRPMTGQPAPRRQRTASVSTNAGATPAPPPSATTSAGPSASSSSRAAPPPPSPLTTTPPSLSLSQIQIQSASSMSVPESPLLAVSTPYDPYPPSRPSVSSASQDSPMQPLPQPTPQPQVPQTQQDDYAMQYSSPDEGMSTDDRRFSAHSSYDSPQSATTMYDPQGQAQAQSHQQQQQQQQQYVQQQQQSQQSPATAYPPTPAQTQAGYYLAYQPPSAPPPSAAGAGYDGHGHPHSMAMGIAEGIAPAMTTISHAHSHPQMHHGYAPRAMTHEYQPQHQQHPHQHQPQHHQPQHHPQAMAGMPPHVQGWGPQGPDPHAQPHQQQQQQQQQHAHGPEMWSEYKYYGGMSS